MYRVCVGPGGGRPAGMAAARGTLPLASLLMAGTPAMLEAVLCCHRHVPCLARRQAVASCLRCGEAAGALCATCESVQGPGRFSITSAIVVAQEGHPGNPCGKAAGANCFSSGRQVLAASVVGWWAALRQPCLDEEGVPPYQGSHRGCAGGEAGSCTALTSG